jgi:hypothetical protein
MPGMAGMDQHWMSMEMTAGSLTEQIGSHNTSGTSAEPNSTPVPMLMTARGAWTLMFHGLGFLSDIQQTSPRAHDQLFSVNWFMPMAQRRLGRGTLTLRAMLSLEPATITGRYYPLLFQQGETAYGNPLVDGQHPHNFFVDRTNELLLGGKSEPAGMGAKLWSAAACCRFPSQPDRLLGTEAKV